MRIDETQKILRAVKLLCMLLQWWVHAIIHSSMSRVNLNGHYGLWVIMMGKCRFTDCNECTSPVWGVDSDGGCVCVCVRGRAGTRLSAPLCCEPKTALKNSL